MREASCSLPRCPHARKSLRIVSGKRSFKRLSETLRVASEARRAFFRAVAARALVASLSQARETGETAAELAKRLGETGAMNKLDQARNQTFYAEMVAQLGTARLRAASERERLVRALGLWGGDLDFQLPAQLPPLPARARALAYIETEAVRRRVDLQMARIEADLLAKSYGLTNATRFINLLDVVGIAKKQREDGETTRERGFEVEVQVPLFDFGEVKVRQAEENYLQAVNRLTAKAVNVRSRSARSLSGLSRELMTSRATTGAKSCLCAKSSRTKRCFATTRCKSTCSRF